MEKNQKKENQMLLRKILNWPTKGVRDQQTTMTSYIELAVYGDHYKKET